MSKKVVNIEIDHNSIHINDSINDEKDEADYKQSVHWSTTENGALVARATNFVYRKIIASNLEGGLKVNKPFCISQNLMWSQGFIEENCPLFINADKEQQLIFTDIYQTYEKHIERLLDEFAASEGMTQVEIMHRIEAAVDENKAARKSLDMLLAATSYNKFSKMMFRKAVERQKRENDMALSNPSVSATHASSPSQLASGSGGGEGAPRQSTSATMESDSKAGGRRGGYTTRQKCSGTGARVVVVDDDEDEEDEKEMLDSYSSRSAESKK